MQVGFVGLGRMGTHMARNIASAGFPLTVWNRTQCEAADLSDEIGCAVAPSLRALSETCDVVITMLSDDPSSQAVHLDTDGLLTAENPAQYVLEMGTMSPDHIAALCKAAPPSVTIIDAPRVRRDESRTGGTYFDHGGLFALSRSAAVAAVRRYGKADHFPRPARRGRGHETGNQFADPRPEPDRVRSAVSGRGRRHLDQKPPWK